MCWLRLTELEAKLIKVEKCPRCHIVPVANFRPVVIRLPYGPTYKMYVDRKAAKDLQDPIVVECMSTGAKHYTSQATWGSTAFKWTGRNDVAPALWVETKDSVIILP